MREYVGLKWCRCFALSQHHRSAGPGMLRGEQKRDEPLKGLEGGTTPKWAILTLPQRCSTACWRAVGDENSAGNQRFSWGFPMNHGVSSNELLNANEANGISETVQLATGVCTQCNHSYWIQKRWECSNQTGGWYQIEADHSKDVGLLCG